MKYSMFIGRWQPWHNGHRWLIEQRLKEGKNILICVREVSKDDKNPYNPIDVKDNVEKELKDLVKNGQVKVIIIPDVESVNYGRGVGYEIIEHVPPTDIKEISATKIRKGYENTSSNSLLQMNQVLQFFNILNIITRCILKNSFFERLI